MKIVLETISLIDKSTSVGTKLLSICMMGRDDDYTHDFKYRVTTTLNYIARNLNQLGRLDDVEILLTDWGSKVPMADSLMFSPEAAQICRVIYVPPDVIGALQNGRQDFHTSMAINVGIRRAKGEFVLQGASDTLIPRHALGMILQVLENKIDLSIRPKETMFVCPRYHIPWQFVERQPRLETWDQYLLLSCSELNYDDESLLPVCAGTAGFLMYRDVWQKARGFDERYGGWGGMDADLGLRISQIYPWVGLSSLGVNFYHMGHRAVGRRVDALAKKNTMDYNSNIEVNNEGWGLADYQFQEQPVKTSMDCAPKAVVHMETQNRAAFDSKLQIEEINQELTSDPVREHVGRSIAIFPHYSIQHKDVEALIFLAWHSMRCYPRCYLEFGIRRGYGAGVVAAISPGVEIYGFDEWEGALDPEGTDIAYVFGKLRSLVGHRAYVRLLNGPLHTGVARLRGSFIGPFCPDLVFVRGERLGEHLEEQVADLLKYLAPGGAIIITSTEAATLDLCWPRWGKQRPQSVLFLSKSRLAGMILANKVQTDSLSDSISIKCDFDVTPILRHVATQRLLRGLSQPGRYSEFAARLLNRFAGRLVTGRKSSAARQAVDVGRT